MQKLASHANSCWGIDTHKNKLGYVPQEVQISSYDLHGPEATVNSLIVLIALTMFCIYE